MNRNLNYPKNLCRRYGPELFTLETFKDYIVNASHNFCRLTGLG